MSPRDKFLEMLSSLSNTPINEDLFIVSPPITVDGIKTTVSVTPVSKSNLYGARVVDYTRFDLSSLGGVSLKSNDEDYSHELVERLVRYNLFKYRIKDNRQPNATKTRFLTLSKNDVESAVLPRVFSTPVTVSLRAAATSDFFVGSLSVTLLPSI